MALVLALGFTLVSVVPAQAASGGHTPDDQPLPGYTIVNPPLTPATVGGKPASVLQGVHTHAGYTIEVPPNWNGKLTMWSHGFAGQGKVLGVQEPAFGLRQRLLDQGYAWAASSYYDNGYDVRAGVVTTKELVSLFGKLVKRPKQVFIAGASMGGHIIGRSLEEYPGLYAGALPVCGAMGDHTLFDYFAGYNLLAQDLADGPAYPFPADYATNAVPRIQQALGLDKLKPGGPDTLNALGNQLRAITTNLSGGPRPGSDASFVFWKDFLFGIAALSTGTGDLAENPDRAATNLFTRYSPNAPADVNRTVQRIVPKDVVGRFSPALTQNPQIQGTPTVPVLSVHGIGDLFVPFSMEQTYREDVARHGRTGLLAQRAIRTANHCEFDAKEIGSAWDDLVTWVDRGKRPAADVVSDPKVVASPTYGCRFTDKAATDGTRALFPACP
ncbi:hypothetical protein [Amycolatopsis sp. H20-H5]|uniref:hypothetical protein n=1 Tax=Amycolatopsis sp. H20-H5 TaxID=3046309 RepID=UPI002DBFD1F4|nr:hypothetical protein [Amycolatopsis sp. H20-H5]MEC3976469.1 hypothetical protein [Amycolatopsis sp. H20-H5]